MLNEDEINALADIFQDRFDKANRKILEYIGSRLKEIGELTPSQARKIQQMYKYGEDLDTITQYLAEVSGQSIDDIEALYEKVAEEGYDWSKPFYEAKGIKQIPFKENKDAQRIIKAMCAVTGKSLKNISRTTAIGVNTAGGFKPVGSFYKETIDSAITAVITGTDDYNSTIRRAVKELGSGGLKIQYESGYRRRLDSAVRQNVLDGVRYVTHEIAVKNGEEFGADGYEISAHSACAPDHLPYQGRQYSKKEYEAIQESLARPIGQWNCGHTAFPIVLGVSHRAYTDKELKAFEQNSNEKITIEGREYTRYECTQLQRKLETKLRYAREEKALYKAVGDKELVNGTTEKIRILKNKYTEVSEKADLPMRAERTKSVTEKLKNKVTNSPHSGILNSGAVSGARKFDGWQDKHANLMYEEIRKRKTDCSKIAQNTIFTEKAIVEIKEHMFYKKHLFADGTEKMFDSDFEQAQAWDRLTKGSFTDTDVILLKHEYVELTEMRLHNLVYEDAHAIANSKHNWFKALMDSRKKV